MDVCYSPRNVNIMNIQPVATARTVVLGLTRSAIPCLAEAVAVAVAGTEPDVVMVRTFGAIVVPATVVAGFVVSGATVLPSTTLAKIICGGIVVGSTVVPGIVVVYVASPPNAFAGMALPTPALVYWVGRDKVEVLGLAASLPP